MGLSDRFKATLGSVAGGLGLAGWKHHGTFESVVCCLRQWSLDVPCTSGQAAWTVSMNVNMGRACSVFIFFANAFLGVWSGSSATFLLKTYEY